ncbi:MAG: hypothetical protein H7126_19335 [Candidatus Parcubacteria bacterium]|nr:hypothetical protein [Phormidesmis priestleyi]MBC7825978.1 hypothetical protein [Leptolyngbyaceae cyanobacterium LF-bin-113]
MVQTGNLRNNLLHNQHHRPDIQDNRFSPAWVKGLGDEGIFRLLQEV